MAFMVRKFASPVEQRLFGFMVTIIVSDAIIDVVGYCLDRYNRI
jgi:hypothetical protein